MSVAGRPIRPRIRASRRTLRPTPTTAALGPETLPETSINIPPSLRSPQYRSFGHLTLTPRVPSCSSERRAVRRARRGTLGENGVRRPAFVEHLDAKLRGNSSQLRREDIRLEQVDTFGEPVTAAAHLDYARSERFDPPDEHPDAGAGGAQSAAQPLFGVEPSVGENSKQRKVGRIHARITGEKRADTSTAEPYSPGRSAAEPPRAHGIPHGKENVRKVTKHAGNSLSGSCLAACFREDLDDMMPSFPNRMASADANIASAGRLQVARRPSKRRQTGETLPSPVFFLPARRHLRSSQAASPIYNKFRSRILGADACSDPGLIHEWWDTAAAARSRRRTPWRAFARPPQRVSAASSST